MLKIRVIFSRMTRGQVVQSNLVERDTCFATTALLVTGSNPTVESGILTAGSISVASGPVCSTSQSMGHCL